MRSIISLIYKDEYIKTKDSDTKFCRIGVLFLNLALEKGTKLTNALKSIDMHSIPTIYNS